MPDAGYPCPKCGTITQVADTRRAESNWLRRRRRCIACNNRFSTIEIPTEVLDSYADVANSKDIVALVRLLAQAQDVATKIRDLPALPANYDHVDMRREK